MDFWINSRRLAPGWRIPRVWRKGFSARYKVSRNLHSPHSISFSRWEGQTSSSEVELINSEEVNNFWNIDTYPDCSLSGTDDRIWNVFYWCGMWRTYWRDLQILENKEIKYKREKIFNYNIYIEFFSSEKSIAILSVWTEFTYWYFLLLTVVILYTSL